MSKKGRRMVAAPPPADDELRDALVARVVEPRSVRNLPPADREKLHELQAVTLELHARQSRQARLVQQLRRAGLSWSALGWAVGTSGEAARQRWGR